MSDEIEERRVLAGFEKSKEFFNSLHILLSADLFSNDPITDAETEAFRLICLIVRFELIVWEFILTNNYSVMNIKNNPIFWTLGWRR